MRTFFGLNEEYKKAVYEEFFLLKQYGSWSFREAYNLPTLVRKWFLKRLIEERKRINEAQEKSTPHGRR